MKKKTLFFIIILFATFFNIKETYAYSSKDYVNRQLCGNYEVAEAKADGTLVKKSCHPNFDQATVAMKKDGSDNLVVLGGPKGKVKIFDATTALVDFSPQSGPFSMYKDIQLKNEYTYMIGESRYGASDGIFLGTGYSSYQETFVYRVKVGGYTGWVRAGYLEIVPLIWVKSTNYYTVTNETIRHNYISKLQNPNTGMGGVTLGPKPEMLSPGTYLSYDGHYFYKDLEVMLKDYKAGNYNNSINKNNPYYNYYQYLPNHTRTSYSSINIDEYIRKNLGFGRDVFGTTALTKDGIKSSRLYGKGTFFYNAQEVYGVNALLALGLSRNETANGTSNLAINKNNGFGLNAVDSSPTEKSDWYAAFSSSILGYANKWVTYGYSEPADPRYNGSQYGNKNIGMNVKYASDVYWSEKMASNYYSMDKALSLQDYNFYQLGITTSGIEAKVSPTTTSKTAYNFRSAENSVVIIDEVEGTVVNGNNKWYKIVSDLNQDGKGNPITSGPYNWNAYVYVPAAYIKKINKGVNGYISPNDVTPYQDKDYTYDIYTNKETMKLAPKVAISTKETMYYYDPTLLSAKGQTLLKNRYVMVFTTAYDKNKQPVAYLVTSDYKYDQKHWVSADSIKFVTSRYGQASVTVPNTNTYTIINPTTVDSLSTHISGLYHYNYVPILEERMVDGYKWYKVPVDLSGNNLEFGWTLASAPDVKINTYEFKASNTAPTITATDKTIVEGTTFDPKKDVKAYDNEDGDLTTSIKVTSNVNNKQPGTYQVTYEVTDKANVTVTKTITVTVIKDEEPVISAENIEMRLGGEKPNLLANVTATDKEDGVIKEITVDDSKVIYTEVGEYPVVYKVKDSFGHIVEKTVNLRVLESAPPVIIASDKTITINSKFDERKGVTAKDYTGKDITESIKVIKNTVKPSVVGIYEVTYQVTDSNNKTTTKTIKVTVSDKEEKEGEFYLDSLKWDKSKKQFTVGGYLIIYDIDNQNKEYEMILKDKNSDQEYSIRIDAWTKDTPYDLGSENGHSYTNSWFKGTIDFSNIPNGDYELYMKSSTDKYYTEKVFDNLFNVSIDKRGEDENHGYDFKVLQRYKSQKMEMSIRNELYTVSSAPTYRDMVNGYEEITFKNNKLYILGYSYNYNGIYDKQLNIKRTLILENQNNYKQSFIDLGSKVGPYKITSLDNKDKNYVWYEKEIDLSNLEKGIYSLQVYTKTTGAEDYGEINDIFGMLEAQKISVGEKRYQIKLNKNRENRVELTVE